MKQHRTLVLGIGNTLLTDEGVGVHVVNHLQQQQTSLSSSSDVIFMDGGTLSFTLAEPIESCDQLIVIDASEIKAHAGDVKVFENDEMDKFITSGNKKSVHEVTLVDVMSIAMLSGNLPEKRALVGIQPDNLDWGNEPTEKVQQAIPVACQHVNTLLQRWQV
ncbi:MAG: hydrogenase maturation protease [Gammaproteobacteria bacterium]|nr:hydrogenase maturation protease [Gammaproteobacteria bacterium]